VVYYQTGELKMEAQMVKSETSLEVKRVFHAPVAKVYRAWTEPEMLNAWFHPDARMRSECTVDLRVGGSYEIQMHGGEGGPFIVGGVYREIIPEVKLAFTWRWQGEETAEMLVTVTFRALDEKSTELTLLHEQFPNDEERDSHAQGWQGTFEQLATAL
jgi:uncharacterized protein YndB with AHSA1/START domain